MMLCPSCGHTNQDDARFCQACGAGMQAGDGKHAADAGHNVASPPSTSGFAIASLVMGILGCLISWFTLGLPAVLAIVFGHLARGRIRRADGAVAGGGMALAGLIMGYLQIGLVLIIVTAIAIPAYQDYAIRTKVHEIDTSLREQVEAHVDRHYELPSDIAGLDVAFEAQSREMVESLVLDGDGRIRVTFGDPIPGQTIIYDPVVGRDGIERWGCAGGTLAEVYRPPNCRR